MAAKYKYLVEYGIVCKKVLIDFKGKYFKTIKEARKFKKNKIDARLFKLEYIIRVEYKEVK